MKIKDRVYEVKTASGHTVRILAPDLMEARRLIEERRTGTKIISVRQARGWRAI